MSILQIKYHPGVCYFQITLPLVMGIISNFIFNSGGIALIIWDLILIAIFLFFFFKTFIPMLKGKVALELNETGIYDLKRGQNVNWDKVTGLKKLSIINNLADFQIGVLLSEKKTFIKERNIVTKISFWVNTLFYSTPFVISLKELAGTNEEIWQEVLTYYRQIKVCS